MSPKRFTLSAASLLAPVLLSIIIVLQFTLCISTPIPVLSIKSPDGDIIDCINKKDQPSLSHPRFKNHQIQEPPTVTAPNKEAGSRYGWQVWHKSGVRCPDGSIPIRRIAGHRNDIPGSNSGDRFTKGHEYAIGTMESKPNVYGTQATMNVWHPHIEVDTYEFSLGQIWLTSGSYEENNVNSIEAGWQVYPFLYHDYEPRFFIYWTTDAYNQTGGYNLRKPGFVQTSSTIAIEGVISPTSAFGGSQADLTIRIWKDNKSDSWWLGVVLYNDILEPVGYWPAFLFTIQVDHATTVQWGGEVVNLETFGRHTATQMGSGCFPDSGSGKVAYMRNLKIALAENDFHPLQDLTVGATHPTYYRAKMLNSTEFYYGGPQQIMSSQAVYVLLDVRTIYFVLGFMLLF